MSTSFLAGKWLFLFFAFAGLVVSETGCGLFDKKKSVGKEESSGFGVAGEQAGSGLAVAGFQFVALQALEQQCDAGQTSACKIAFAVDPDYKNGKTQQEIQDTLVSMDKKLGLIDSKLSDILGLLDGLASQLNIAVADLKLDNKELKAEQYMSPVKEAYDYLKNNDFTDTTTVDAPLIVRSMMTNGVSSDPWDVPFNLSQLHESIIDNDLGQGLLSALDAKAKANIDAIWKGGRSPSYAEAINNYEFMEQYFGYLLMQQAKGLVVISASYNYLSIYPTPSISDQLVYKTFNKYMEKVYVPNMELQVEVFLKHVENYIAYTADVDKPGKDVGMAADGSNTDIQGWTSVVLKRADLMAAWARASLKTQGTGTPVLLAVRVLGEPDRSKLLYSSGTITDVQAGKQYAVDKGFLKLVPGQAEGYRILTARQPYLQFPVHLGKTKGTVERDGAMKGANSFIMNQYMLTDSDSITAIDGEKRQIGVPEWVGIVDPMEVKLVGPDGNAPQPGEKEMYYGHTTIVLKETAARLGVWSHGNPGDITNKTIDNLVKTAKGTDSFPQSIQLYVYADPHASEGGQCAGSDCWAVYYAKGHGYFNEQLISEYYFEGWGDVPASQTGKVSAMLSGKTTHLVDPNLRAQHGAYSMELYFAMNNGSQPNSSTDENDVTLPVTSAATWADNTTIKFFIEPRIKLDWEAERTSSYYKGGSCTFLGTMKFDLSSLVLQVK